MNRRTLILIIAVFIGIGIGALTAARLASDNSSDQGLSRDTKEILTQRIAGAESDELSREQVDQVVESLIQILDEEIAERHLLAEQLEEVRLEMTDLKQNLRARVEAAFAAKANSDESATPRITTLQQRRALAAQSIEDRLATAGFTPLQIQTLRLRQAEAQMQQIEMDDRARRDGWYNTPRYYQEISDLTSAEDAVRRDLGDHAYERYLFASGRPNRISVGAVIETSPAEAAGLLPGDIIMSYAGERIFSTQQLTSLRSTGDRGAPVTLEIIRSGEPMQITMPRGPMGVQTRQDRIDPSAPGGN